MYTNYYQKTLRSICVGGCLDTLTKLRKELLLLHTVVPIIKQKKTNESIKIIENK